MHRLQQLLLDVFRAQGLLNPERAAEQAFEVVQSSEYNARIYEQRKHSTNKQIAVNHGKSERRIRQIIKAEIEYKRK